MKNSFIIFLLVLTFFNCKKSKNQNGNNVAIEKIDSASVSLNTENYTAKIIKNSLRAAYDFEPILNSIVDIKNMGSKHADWMSNRVGFMDRLLGLKRDDINIETTSYSYKKECVFYLHTLKHTNDALSIKSFLENAQGKRTEGYTGERILIFAMKDDRKANFIDIPANWNHIKLKEELVEVLLEKIDSDIIICNRTKKCGYKDLRKTKPGG